MKLRSIGHVPIKVHYVISLMPIKGSVSIIAFEKMPNSLLEVIGCIEGPRSCHHMKTNIHVLFPLCLNYK